MWVGVGGENVWRDGIHLFFAITLFLYEKTENASECCELWVAKCAGEWQRCVSKTEACRKVDNWLDSSGMFQNFLGTSITFQKFLKRSRTFQKLLESSRMFQNVLEVCRNFRNVAEFSRMFPTVLESFEMFQNFLECSCLF